jgi:hypothetical protein
MLRPVIMIGCGGSGQKSIRYVRDAVQRHLAHQGWTGDFPRAWQFVGIDTPTKQEDPSVPFLPTSDYISVSLNYDTFAALNGALLSKFPPHEAAFKELMGWRPSPEEVAVPLSSGAGQLRAVGRAAGVLALQTKAKVRVKHAFDECSAGAAELVQISRLLGVDVPPGAPTPKPITIVVGSMAGGTGAGIALDVVDLIRRTDDDGQFPVLVAFTPDIFGDVKTDMMTANSAAFMSELMSAYWDNEPTDNHLVTGPVPITTRGPHSVFVIGRRNIDGLDLSNSRNVYRAVGEALAAVVTDINVQENYHEFITTNWDNQAKANAGGYGFGKSYMKGVASSFGSVTVSIGRDRFRTYLTKLLHRNIVERLVEGYNSAAKQIQVENSDVLKTPEGKISELARSKYEKFIMDCELRERDGMMQISSQFASAEMQAAENGRVAGLIRQGLPGSQNQTASTWLGQIKNEVIKARIDSLAHANTQFEKTLAKWGTESIKRVMSVSSDTAAQFSIPVANKMIQMMRSELLESASTLRQLAIEDRKQAQFYAGEMDNLSGDGRSTIGIGSGPVSECITSASVVVTYEWTAAVRDRVAATIESVATSMLSGIEAALTQALNGLQVQFAPQNGKDAIIEEWPQTNGEVPVGFMPSPVEFFLEDVSSWPQTMRNLLDNAVSTFEGLPSNSIDAARILILRGNYSGQQQNSSVLPFIWTENPEPKWSPESSTMIQVEHDLEKIASRIEAWVSRPNTDMSTFMNENLRDYLSAVNPQTDMPVIDHASRLSKYAQRLQEGLSQSRPLVEINTTMYPTVHEMPLDYDLNVQGFPFGPGHPARELTRGILQGFLDRPGPLDEMFNSSSSESVLISTFLKYPVHPSVITSFTEPFYEAIQRINDSDTLQASFWLWRRARILENFVPLPDDLRRAAIRGYAIARSLGYMTADVKIQNTIVGPGGQVYKFPRWLLTKTNNNNILPALLEAMVLTFADSTIAGKGAFDAYRILIEYGTGGGLLDAFDVDGELFDFLQNGTLKREELDKSRAQKVKGETMEQRCDNVIAYLNQNIEAFDKIRTEGVSPKSWRIGLGQVDPPDTLRFEILEDLIKGYVQVREAVKRVREQEEQIS